MFEFGAGVHRATAGYNTSVARFCLFLFVFVSLSFAQGPPPIQEQEPPEEDVAFDPKTEYVLNPLQAEKEIKVGNYYFKKGSYKAAVRRFEESIKWDPNSAEGWYRLGEARFKLGAQKEAREAWAKYLEVEPEGKYVSAVKKRLASKN